MEKECKGIVFRARVNHYFREYEYPGKPPIHRIINNVELSVLRKKSCLGCEKCGDLWDNLENIDNNWPVSISEVEDGKMYQLTREVESIDHYTGKPEDWFFTLKEIGNEK